MIGSTFGLRLLRRRGPQLLVLGMLALLVVAFRVLQFAALTRQIQWGYDFSAYWDAAARLIAGASPYAAAQLAGPYPPQVQYLYLYPPPLAAAVEPLAAVFPSDYRAAAWIWFALGLTVLVGSVLALARSMRIADRYPVLAGRGRWLLAAGALAFPPVIGELVLGNVHLVLLGLLTIAWLGIRRGTTRGEWIAGAAIGVAAVIKVFPGALLLWLLLTGRVRGAAGAVVAALAVSLLALPLTGLQPWLDYPTVLANLSAPIDVTDTLAPTVWLTPVAGFAVGRVVVTVAGLAILAWSAWAVREKPPIEQLARSFAAAVVIAVLISPAVYQHYLALLVLPLMLGLGAGVPLRYLVVAYFCMWGGKQEALGDAAWIVNRALPTIGALILLIGLVVPRSARHPVAQELAGTI